MTSNLVSNLGSQTFNTCQPWPPVKSENGHIKFSNSVKLGDQILRPSKILTFTKVLLQNQPMCICFKITQSISAQNRPKYICFKINESTYVCCKIHQSTYMFVKLHFCSNPSETLLHLFRSSYTCWNIFFCKKCPHSWTLVHRWLLFKVPLYIIWKIGVNILDLLANLVTTWCQNTWSFGKFGWCQNTWTLANWCQNTWSFVKSVRKLKDM